MATLSLILFFLYLPTVYASLVEVVKRQSYEVPTGKLGAVASESALCSRHGTDMLEEGGNAADVVGCLLLSFV